MVLELGDHNYGKIWKILHKHKHTHTSIHIYSFANDLNFCSMLFYD